MFIVQSLGQCCNFFGRQTANCVKDYVLEYKTLFNCFSTSQCTARNNTIYFIDVGVFGAVVLYAACIFSILLQQCFSLVCRMRTGIIIQNQSKCKVFNVFTSVFVHIRISNFIMCTLVVLCNVFFSFHFLGIIIICVVLLCRYNLNRSNFVILGDEIRWKKVCCITPLEPAYLFDFLTIVQQYISSFFTLISLLFLRIFSLVYQVVFKMILNES